MYQTLPKNNFDTVGDFVSTDGMTVREKVDHNLKIIEDQLSEIEEKFGYRLLSEEGLKRYTEVCRYWDDRLKDSEMTDDELVSLFIDRSKDINKVFDGDPIRQKWKPIVDNLEFSKIFWEAFKDSRRYKYGIKGDVDLN